LKELVNVCVTGAGGSAASNFIDSLNISKGLSVGRFKSIGVDTSEFMINLSKADRNFVIQYKSDDEFNEKILSLILKHEIDFLQPQPDNDVLRISKIRNLLGNKVLLPSEFALKLARNKQDMAMYFTERHIPVPKLALVSDRNDLADVSTQLLKMFPKVWVRATVGAGSKASLPCSSVDQILNWVNWWIEERGFNSHDFMVSEYLPGKEYALQTLWKDGVLIASQARQRIKYLYGFLAPSGQSSTPQIAKTVSETDIYSIGHNAIQTLDSIPNGIYCVDMKRDINDNLKITEINAGRFFTTSNFFSHAGLNMPQMLVDIAMGEKVDPIKPGSLDDNLYWIRMVDMGFKIVTDQEIFKWLNY